MEETELTQQENSYKEYIEQINALKANTVSKDDYEALKAERNELISNLINGSPISTDTEPVEKPSREDLVKVLSNRNTLDSEYIKAALELRNQVLEQDGYDCFAVTNGKQIPTVDQTAGAERTAQALQACLDDFDGNQGKLIANLQSMLRDVAIPRVNNKHR